jgi:RHS repeat-associated protein
MLVDSLDRPVAKYLYDPYGNLVSQSGPLAEANVYRFSSKAYDPRSGLYNFGRRFYAPSLQRWLNRDPIGIEGGKNLYAYVGNRPINAFDPTGLAAGELVSKCAPLLVALASNPWAAWTSFTLVDVIPAGATIFTIGGISISGMMVYVPAYLVFGYTDPNSQAVYACSGNQNDPPIRLTAPLAITTAIPGVDPNRNPALADKAPGQPTAGDGFVPPKRGAGSDGQPVKNPNGPGRGWVDQNGDVWVPTGEGPLAHGGPHWDVQTPGGGYRNVYPGGRIR